MLPKTILSLVSRSANRSRRLVRILEHESSGRCTLKLKVYKYTLWDRLTRFSSQSFTYWPISLHFTDISGKDRFLKMDDLSGDHHELFTPPNIVNGMKILDRSVFKRKCKIPGIKVPFSAVAIISKKLKSSMLRVPKLKAVADLEDGDAECKTHKLLLLNPSKCNSANDFSENEKLILKEKGVEMETFQHYDIELRYENWPASDILRAILPYSAENISGFSIIGHIAHLNLKEDVTEFKNIIGEVILDKNPSIKTVVNKTGEIDNTYRNFKMEVLAGENNLVVQSKEHGFLYEFDFSKVYWNPRLATEHQRVIDDIKEGDVAYDVFAGVGPFAVPTAKKKKAIVYANDLNPSSYESLCKNMTLNKVKTEIHCSNLDGREFIRTVIKPDMVQRWKNWDKEGINPNLKVIMNLPAIAIEFTDAFVGLCRDLYNDVRPTSEDMLPYLYVYCFSKSQTPEADVKERIENIIGTKLPDGHIVRFVRNVAPGKEMLCVCFHMPSDVLFGDIEKDDLEPEAKKKKMDNSS